MKTILVFGISGLVGGRLARELRSRGYQVRGATRLAEFCSTEVEELFRVDWKNQESLERACQGAHAVIHLACPNFREVEASPQIMPEYFEGVQALVRAMKSQRVARGVYLSSIHVYGGSLHGVVTERTPPNPQHPYGRMHEQVERLLGASGTPWVILRSTNGVGWPVRPETNCWALLANDLCRQAAQTGSARLHARPDICRDFLALGEILRALEYGIQQAPPGLYLLASGQTRTTGWLAGRIADEYLRQTGKKLVGLPSHGEPAQGPEFFLDTRKLAQEGFLGLEDLGDEISRLMQECLHWFGPARSLPGTGQVKTAVR